MAWCDQGAVTVFRRAMSAPWLYQPPGDCPGPDYLKWAGLAWLGPATLAIAFLSWGNAGAWTCLGLAWLLLALIWVAPRPKVGTGRFLHICLVFFSLCSVLALEPPAWTSGGGLCLSLWLTVAAIAGLAHNPMAAGITGLVPWTVFLAASPFFDLPMGLAGQTVISFGFWLMGTAAVFKFSRDRWEGFEAGKRLGRLKRKIREHKADQDNELIRMNKSLALEIRAHTEAETRLRESEEKYRNLVNSLPEGIFIVQDNKIVYLNPGLETLTGMDSKALFAMDPHTLFSRVRQANGYAYILRGDGAMVFIEKQEVEIRFNSRSATLFTVRNISDQVRSRMEKNRLESELAKAKKMEALGLLAAGVAHDLNNVLSGIVSTPELLLMELPEESPMREAVLTIKDSGKRASVIVDELLTLGRGAPKVLEPVNLNREIRDYLGSPEYKKSCDFHPRVRMETRLDEGLPDINASGLQLRKVVMNLVTNAMEAIVGSGRVTLETSGVRLRKKALKGYEKKLDGEYVRLRVADTGPGINGEDLERIFEPFYTKKILGRSGTGLGLSIVWNVVRDHKGYVQVESKPQGTFFDLYFPVSAALQDSQKTDKIYTLSDYAGNNEAILVVDDEKNQLKITSNMLRRMGYRVSAASSGEAAVEHLDRHSVDLVILDMIMSPGIGGLATFEALRRVNPGIRAVLASGYAKTREVVKAQELGAGPFIKKPFSLQTLGLAVKEELGREKRESDIC